MKKGLLSLLVVTTLVLVGCEPPVKTEITIDPTTLNLLVGDTSVLSTTITPAEIIAEVVWSSSNSAVATVDANGTVVAMAEGTANITASVEGVDPTTCVVTVENIPTSFPRKHLIEHFTGDGCGYCPEGMFALAEYTQNINTSCIWVSHHYGYNNDEYTINESSKIGGASGVNGAPKMAFNRTKMMGTTIAFHPGYLVGDGMAETIASKCANEAEASVVINHTYNANQLDVKISGLVANPEVNEYLLTVIVKENGLTGKQADYQYSWKTKGFKEFLHPRVTRCVLTAALGDTILVKNQRYSKSLTYTLPENWVAENCCIVAYITPLNKKPVINAEQVPLVTGTTGGEEYLPYGITEIEAPTNVTKLAFTEKQLKKTSDNKLLLTFIASNSTRSEVYGPMKLITFVEINTTESTLKEGVYTIAEGNEMNTISAGTTDKAKASFGGSLFTYITSTSLETDTWQHCHYWRMQTGTMTVNTDGSVVLEGKLYNSKTFKATYTPVE